MQQDTEHPIQIWIFAYPPSMKNQRKIVHNPRTGKPMVIKSERARLWVETALQQITGDKKLGWGSLDDPLRATVHVWYLDRRPDLDCALVFDMLQEAGVISNDRYIYEKHLFKHFVGDGQHQADGIEITIEKLYCGTEKETQQCQ